MAWTCPAVDKTQTSVSTTESTPITFQCNGKECMHIDPSGRVGIGTTSPDRTLHVASSEEVTRIKVQNTGPGQSSITFANPDERWTWYMMKDNALKLYDHKGGADRIVFGTSGNVGIGTTSPIGTLDVKLAANQHINFIPNVNGTFNGTPGIVSINDVNNAYTPMGFYASQYYFGGGNIGIGTSAPQSSLHVDIPGSCNPISGLTIDVQSFGTYDNAKASHFLRVRDILANPPNGATYFMIRGDGNVGIRTNAPESALHVVGDVRVTGDVLLTGADCAEHFDIVGERPEPGTVVAIDQNGALRESQKAYDKSVAGVISGAGEYRHGIVLDKRSCDEGRIPVALVGKVYCKVDAHCSRVQVGDLLTTSPTPGHAMKVTDQAKAFGAVLGKALAPLQNGCGLIPILVALQ